jgi:hypothetical protein
MVTNLPQPSFYLYYIRLRDMKKIKNGSDNDIKVTNLPQPYFYLYYI